MTIVTTIITSNLTVHAADSLLTRPIIKNQKVIGHEIVRRKARKIVRVPRYAGAMSYWGLGTIGIYGTQKWLSLQLGESKNRSAEEFAEFVAERLNSELNKMTFSDPFYRGIGIHFSVYEKGVPELFLITNYQHQEYKIVDQKKVHFSRETFLHSSYYDNSCPSTHWRENFRKLVQAYLDSGNWLIYNNGDPSMFNPIANAVLNELRICSIRESLNESEKIELVKTVAVMPIEMVSKIQHKVFKPKQQLVGAPIYSLAIRPVGTYESDTGD